MTAPPPAKPTVTGDAYFGWAREEMRPFLPARCGKVLEIGCGAGAFLGGIQTPAETWGIEPDAGAAEIARSRLDRVINGTFEDALAELPLRYFDTVICNDVIEHMADHDRFFDTIKNHIAGEIDPFGRPFDQLGRQHRLAQAGRGSGNKGGRSRHRGSSGSGWQHDVTY